MRSRLLLLLLSTAMSAQTARGAEALQWSGFALLRGSTPAEVMPLRDEELAAQVQVGLDWRPSMLFGGHLQLAARTDDRGSKRGHAGIVQAYLEQNVVMGEHRLHFTEGAFFLATSRENVDALWENPYTITSSALNSWLGEELRPIGVDAAYTYRRAWTAGLTLFRGNDTFGALPAVRGWSLHDHWALLGEHLPVDDEYFTSVSAETDGRLGYAARGRWNNDHALVQLTHIDNRSDALEYGELFNWDTRFSIAAAEYNRNDWTIAAENGWGVTDIIVAGVRYSTDIRATYLLVSRRFESFRVSVRGDEYRGGPVEGHALTTAVLWSPRGRIRTGIEGTIAGDERRVLVDVRYSFSRQ